MNERTHDDWICKKARKREEQRERERMYIKAIESEPCIMNALLGNNALSDPPPPLFRASRARVYCEARKCSFYIMSFVDIPLYIYI